MKLFTLVRREDVTGVSGTGVVAEGVLFGDGSAVTRWLSGPYHSTVIWPAPNAFEAINKIHGHDGKTVIEWSELTQEIDRLRSLLLQGIGIVAKQELAIRILSKTNL